MKFELHQISRCGFYERGVKQPVFGALSEWDSELPRWIHGRANVSQTSTFQTDKEQHSSVYCVGSTRKKSGLGLILWHGVPATEKGIAYITMNAKPGEVAVSEAELASNSIPGWASYYWALPSKNLLVCMQPAGRMRNHGNGLPDCREYLKGWLQKYSQYVQRIKRIDSQKQAIFEIGWRKTAVEKIRFDLTVHFDTQPYAIPCALDEVRSRYNEIRKLVHSVKIRRALPEDRNLLSVLLDRMGFSDYSPPEDDQLSFRWESDWQPSLRELDSLIDRQNMRNQEGRRERQAVRFRGDSTLYWLDGGPVRDEVDLPVSLETSLYWSLDQLEQAWEYTAPRIERLIPSSRD